MLGLSAGLVGQSPGVGILGTGHSSTQPSSLLTGCVAFWKLEEATGNRLDSTGRGNNLAPTNTPGNTTGKIGNALALLSASTQYVSIADNADLSMGPGVHPTFAGWFKCTDLSAIYMVFSKYTTAGSQREYRMYIATNGSVHFGASSTGANNIEAATGTGVVTAGVWVFFVAWYDGTNLNLQINNTTIFTAAFSADIFNGTAPFQLGQETAESLKMNGAIDAPGEWKRVLTADERATLYNAGDGLEYPFSSAGSSFTLLPAMLADNAYSTDMTNYYQSSTFARVLAQTTATAMQLTLYDNLNTDLPGFDQINIRVNGSDYAQIDPSANGLSYPIVTLPGGSQQIEVVGSCQSRPVATIEGTFLNAVSFNAPATLSQPVANRWLIYGDSIPSGGNASVPSRDAWTILLRIQRGINVSTILEAYGYRSLWDDANTAPLIAAFVAQLVSTGSHTYIFTIGTNDYGLNKWSAASFGTAYAAVVDGVKTADPAAVFFLVTPLLRSSEAANGSGSTMGNYRTQIATIQSTRSSFCTFVDGTTITTLGDLADGIHPTTAGHIKVYLFFKSLFGL